jgi:uncharacterized protein (TIGR03435 family)
MLPARRIGTRRSHFTVAAVVVVAAATIGLYAARRAGLFEVSLPVQQQTQPQISPASQSPAVSVDPVPERGASGRVAESKDSKQPAIVAEATGPFLSRGVDAGARASLRIDGKPSQGTSLAFEVASIKPVPPPIPTGNGPWRLSEGRFRTERGFVRDVIRFAYGVLPGFVKGGPDWLNREPYDFDARAGNVAAGPDQIRLMLQTLLTERFKLAIHFDTEEATVYTLVVAKDGPKLQNTKGGQAYGNWTGPGQLTASNAPLASLASILSGQLDNAPVLDETGLRGNYDFSFEFTRPRDPRPTQTNSPPDLFTALQEQLGLELRASKRRVEVIVIDHIERPSEN